ncbi:MAG: NfeD family protein [Planctomycetota bacterium]
MVPILFAHPVGWVLLAVLALLAALAVWQVYGASGAVAAWAAGIGLVVVLAVLSWVLTKLAPRSQWGRGLVLERDEDDDAPAAVQVTRNAPQGATQEERRRELVGKTGVARTHLRPAGTAVLDGDRVDVVADGERIDAGSRVEVVAVQGNRVVVRRVQV